MFFILSKLLLIFIFPFTWIIAFTIAALISKKPKRRRNFFIISASLLLIFSNPFLFNRFAAYWDVAPVKLPSGTSYSCVIVLGGFSSVDKHNQGFFNISADRFIQGLKLLQSGRASHILISGGNASVTPNSFRESDWVRTQLKDFNVPDSSILVENQSRNTLENARFSRILFGKRKLPPPYLLVTSGFHMRRAESIFKKQHLDVIPYPCNYFAGRSGVSWEDFVPDVTPLASWNIYIKELVGSAVYYFK